MIPADDARVLALTRAVQTGDVGMLEALLVEHPGLATERFGDDHVSRTSLHVVTDWPGNFARAAETIAVLVRAGADVNGRFAGAHAETPLHWAASSNDVAAIDALLDAGADLEADGAVLTGGPPMDDAIVFAQYLAARRLADRGAVTKFWHDAPLGHVDRVRDALDAAPNDRVDREQITNACWHAARAGQLAVVELLVEAGADLSVALWDERTIVDAAVVNGSADVVAFLSSRSDPLNEH